MAGVLPFPLVRRKRAERTAGSKNEDLPSSKRSRQGLWIVNNSLEMSEVPSKSGKAATRTQAAGAGVGAVQRCSCCSDNQRTPRRSSRLARKKGSFPSAASCSCSGRTSEVEDKENQPSEEPLCLTPVTSGRKKQRAVANEFSLLVNTWGMELKPPVRTRRSIVQKATTRTPAPTTSTPRSARRGSSLQQTSSPTSELAAQLEDLVFTGQQTPGTQPLSPPQQHPTTRMQTLGSIQNVPQVKATEKNSRVVLEEERDVNKDKLGSYCMSSDSVESGPQSVAGEEDGEPVSGGKTLCKSLTAGKYARSKKEKRKSIGRVESLCESVVVGDPARSKEEGKVVSVEDGLVCKSSEVDKRTRSMSDEATSSSPLPKTATSPFTDELLCRETELAALEAFLKRHVCGKRPGSLYVSGPPGTGKSASINNLLDSRPDLTESACVVVLNCMTLRSPQAIFSSLLEHLQPLTVDKRAKQQMRSSQDRLTHIITHSKKTILLVLDEMDQLDSKGQEILYSIFEWSSLPTSQLVLIGIANALDLTDRILPRLQMRPQYRPQLLNFPPYDKDQLVTILEKKLPSLLSSGVTFDPMAVQFCARKVSSVHGDLRKAVDICRRSVEVFEAKRKQAKGLESGSCQSRVSIPIVAEVIGEVYGARMVGGAQDTFPLQQKMAICTLLLLVKGKSLKEVELGKLHSAYVKVCQKRKLKFESESEFVDVCSNLQSRGVLSVRKAKERRLAKVTLNLQESEVNHALQDTALLSSVLEAGL